MHNSLESHLGKADSVNTPGVAATPREASGDGSPVPPAVTMPKVPLQDNHCEADAAAASRTRASRFRRPFIARLLTQPVVFRLLERLGLHLTRVHFYQPIPDTRALDDSIWDRSESPALAFNINAQTDLLHHMSKQYGSEFEHFLERSKHDLDGFHMNNRAFESVDAEMLYWIIRETKPNRIIEVGAGHSTLLVREALEATAREDPSHRCKHTIIDPYPVEFLRGRIGDATFQPLPIQRAPLKWVEELESGDILFLDTTHVACTGSDVIHEILEILPRLKQGVLVHFHDIFTPYEYPKSWLKQDHRFWTEQYLLEAFLAFNTAFEIIWSGHLMHREHPVALSKLVPSYDPAISEPGSFWIKRRSDSSSQRVDA